jgi:opacity protein-like surface antigen
MEIKMRVLFFVLALVATTVIAAEANAADQSFAGMSVRPYVGIEYDHIFLNAKRYSVDTDLNLTNDFSGDLMDDRYSAFVPNLGARLGSHFGVEAGYLWALRGEESLTGQDALTGFSGTSKTRISGVHIDGNGYLPLGDKLEAIGSVGVGFYRAHTKISGTIVTNGFTLPGGGTTDTDHDTAFRLGAGLQYNFSNNVSLRGMVRYIGAEFEDGGTTLADNMWTGALGLSYSF